MQTSNNVSNGAVTSTDGRWNQLHSTNMLPNTTPPVWNELPQDSVPSVPASTNYVSSDYHGTSSVNHINVLSNQLVYNPPNYMNIPYPGNAVPNGYTTINPTRGINPQTIHRQNLLRTQNGQIIGGPGCSNQSALGRFISHSQAWASNKTTGKAKKQKRIRTIFTSQQMMQLEQEFATTPYLDRARRLELADFLGLNERTIKIWFQNRRMKKKKDQAESMEDSEDVSTSVPSPEMRNIHVPMPTHAPASMPRTSTPTSVPVQCTYPTYMSEEECQALYQQLELQVQHYQPPYTEVQQLSSEVEPGTDSPTSSAPSAITEESSDLPWLRISLNF